ncbi:MAG: hypothetical protein HY769_02490, partial [Candidatus Stahlbacteria bacterium]|nr:hypothetical protein [Candidatus Stahlbacteria bacterium]
MGKKKSIRQPNTANRTPKRFNLLTESTINKIFIYILLILPLIYFASLLSGTKMMYGSDWLLAGYSTRKWVVECFKHYLSGPMWDGAAFCGLPFGNTYTFYYLLYLILPIHIAWTYIFVLAVAFAGLGIYLYLKELKLSIYSCFLGAITYMGSGAVLSMTYAGHDGKILATAFFPFILLTLHKAITRRKMIYFLFAGAIGGIAAINSHFQLIYYAVIVCIVYLIYHLICQRKENGLKGTARILSYVAYGLLMALGLMAIHYLPIFGTMGWGARGGERGYAFASSWSMPPAELLDLLTPHFSGLLNNYWGENYFKLHTEYLGILPLLLGLIGITQYKRDKYIRFFIWLGIVTIIFALGSYTPIYRMFYSILPGVKKFRAPSMIFYLTSFSISVLAALGYNYLQTHLGQRTED